METQIKQHGLDLTWLRHTLKPSRDARRSVSQLLRHLPLCFSPLRSKPGRLSREAEPLAVTSRWRPSLWKTQLVIWKPTGEDKGLNPWQPEKTYWPAGAHARPALPATVCFAHCAVSQLILNTWMASCGPRHVNSSRSSHAVHFSLDPLCVVCKGWVSWNVHPLSSQQRLRATVICLSATVAPNCKNIFTPFASWFVSCRVWKWWATLLHNLITKKKFVLSITIVEYINIEVTAACGIIHGHCACFKFFTASQDLLVGCRCWLIHKPRSAV